MKKRITRISIHSTSMTVASMYAIVILAIGIIIMVVGTPIALIAGRALDNDMSVGIWIAGALAFTVFGTIFYALARLRLHRADVVPLQHRSQLDGRHRVRAYRQRPMAPGPYISAHEQTNTLASFPRPATLATQSRKDTRINNPSASLRLCVKFQRPAS